MATHVAHKSHSGSDGPALWFWGVLSLKEPSVEMFAAEFQVSGAIVSVNFHTVSSVFDLSDKFEHHHLHI